MASNEQLKKRAIISFYKRLMKDNRVQQNGPAYRRMRQLEKNYIRETRWLRSRLKDNESVSFSWLNESLN